MSKYLYDITYIYGQGRKEKLESEDFTFSKEFFYGYPYFKEKNYKLNIVEAKTQDFKKIRYRLLKEIDKFLSKITKLTFYSNMLITRKNLYIMFNSRNLITSNHGNGNSLSLIVLILKTFKKINFITIVSGLFNLQKTNFLIRFFRFIFLKIYLYTVNFIVFTNRSEYELASKYFHSYKKKFICLPFCIDENYWKSSSDYNPSTRNQILFIGNNGHRDFQLALDIAKNLPEYNFKFITNKIFPNQINSQNVVLVKGDWNYIYLTDDEIKEEYNKSKIVIMPLKNSIVSAGQSVGLQAAAMGVPLVISDTIGFWDRAKYTDAKNIVFVKENNLETWIKVIVDLYQNDEKLNTISRNSILLVKEFYNLDNFNYELEKLIKK